MTASMRALLELASLPCPPLPSGSPLTLYLHATAPQGFDLQAYPRAPAGFTVALSLAEQGWFAAQTAFSQHFIDFVKSFLFSVSGRKWDKDSKSWCFKMEVYEQVGGGGEVAGLVQWCV